MMPLSHCEQSNKTTMLKRQTATVEKRFPDFWQILPEWAPNRCLGYYDTSECPENTAQIWKLSIVINILGGLAVQPVQSQPVWAEIPC
jgi:hypothetical protein